MIKSEEKSFSYEEAFQRLETILSTLNEGQASLDQSLHLFEEANGLIETCSKLLNTAEKRIEKLVKGRDQKLQLDEQEKPLTESFQTSMSSLNPETGELM